MYEMHHDIIFKIVLLYTNSFWFFTIISDNVYQDIQNDNKLRQYFDMLELPVDNEGYFRDNKKKLGYFKG